MSEEIFKESIFTQHDVENKQSKEKNEELRKENEKLKKENEQLRKNNVVKDVEIKESIEKSKEIKVLINIKIWQIIILIGLTKISLKS